MSVLVLGGSGFIGSHVLDHLIKSNQKAINFSRSPSKYNSSCVEFLQGDFQNTAKLSEALQGVSTVIHCISNTVPATSAIDPVDDIKSNLVGTVRLIELIRKVNPSAHLIYISSGGTVYGSPSHIPVREDDQLRPISSYGAVKVAVENFIGVARAEWGLDATILRPSNPYGERQGHKGVQGLIGTVLNLALQNKPITIFGDGNVTRDYLYVKDLAELIVRATTAPSPGTYNCGSGQGHTINQILETIEAVTNIQIKKIYRPKRVFDVEKIVLCSQKALTTFDWKSETSLENGVRRQLDELQNQFTTATPPH